MLIRFKAWLESLKHQPAPDPDIALPPGCVLIPGLTFALSLAIGGTVLMHAAGFWWFPILTATVLSIGPLLTNEPWSKRFALAIAGLGTLGLSYATFPLFFLLFEWDWYEEHFNDKGTGPLGFFIFTIGFVLTTGYLIYRVFLRLFARTPTVAHPDDARMPKSG